MNRPLYRWTHAVFLVALGWLSFLKEDPVFYTNKGGWPVLFRHSVALGFYPILAAMGVTFLLLARGDRESAGKAGGFRTWSIIEIAGFTAIIICVILK